MIMRAHHLAAGLFVLASTLCVSSAAPIMLHFQIEPQAEECFYEDVALGAEIEATVLVYRGGKLDVKLRIETPDKVVIFNQLLLSNVDDTTGKLLNTIVKKGHKFRAPQAGTYTICADNRMAKWTAKVVTLEIEAFGSVSTARLGEKDTSSGTAESAGEPVDTVSGLKASSARLHSKLLLVENWQFYHYHREKRHRETLESTDSRVTWWTFVEAASILLLTAGQIIVVRTWFTRHPGGGGLPGSRLGV